MAHEQEATEACSVLDVSDEQEPTQAVCSLLDLSNELMELVGCAVLVNSPRDALRLYQTCRNVCQSLGRMKALVEARRLRWLPELTAEHEISDDGRTLTCTRSAGSDDLLPWVSGGLLPNQGKSAWKVRVLRSLRNDGNGMFVGVCDATSCWAWGLFLFSGRLRRVTRDANGKIDLGAQPPDGLPNGNYQQIIKNPDGRPGHLKGRATGALIEVSVDHDAGTLCYRIGGGPSLLALPPPDRPPHLSRMEPRVFPQGAALRPYAACYYAGDCLRFESACFVSADGVLPTVAHVPVALPQDTCTVQDPTQSRLRAQLQ